MRRTCQVWLPADLTLTEPKQCGELAVDYAEAFGVDPNDVVRIWMCAKHWDEWQKENES